MCELDALFDGGTERARERRRDIRGNCDVLSSLFIADVGNFVLLGDAKERIARDSQQ